MITEFNMVFITFFLKNFFSVYKCLLSGSIIIYYE